MTPFLKDHVIDGTAIARALRQKLADQVQALGCTPGVAFIRVGEDPASKVYVRAKERAAKAVGILSRQIHLPSETTEAELIHQIQLLNDSEEIHGILLQLPLPPHIGLSVLNEISPLKDVDGFQLENLGGLLSKKPALAPCTPTGIMHMLETLGVQVQGKHAVVVGRSLIVGRPMGSMLLRAGATVTTCHRHTVDLWKHTSEADILVVATGVARLLGYGDIKEGAWVFDVGITRTNKGLVGDVHLEGVVSVVQGITPVPGGVGPMTVASLLQNVVKATMLQEEEGRT